MRSSIFGTRWLGETKPFVLLQDASIKYTTGKEEYEWAGSVKAMHVVSLLDERRRGLGISWDDTARAQGIEGVIFGTDGKVDKYRASIGFRGPLYKRWIYWELDPGLEWEEEEDYATAVFIRLGIDLLFWGRAYE